MAIVDIPVEPNFHRARNIFDALEIRARATPDRIYLYEGERTYRFQDIYEGAVARAKQFAVCGIELDDKIAVIASRSAASVEAIFALALLGANITLFDVGEPFDRLRAALAGAASKIIVVEESSAAEFASLGAIVALADDSRLDRRTDDHDPLEASRGGGAHIAFTFFNTGCGGERRAVEFSHQSLLAEHLWLQRKLRLAADDRQLARSALSDMNILRELIWPIVAGCGCCLLPPGRRNRVAAHLETIARYHVTVVGAVPILIEALLTQARGGSSLATLKRVICTTDLFLGEQFKRFRTLLPDVTFYNVYGLSEALYISSYDNAAAASDGNVMVARAEHLRPMILTDAFDEVGVDQVGRLFVSGLDMVARQWTAPEPTAAHVVATASAALFDTGRLAYKSIDGAIHLIGRPEQLVNIGQ